jgi:hypothetical protein
MEDTMWGWTKGLLLVFGVMTLFGLLAMRIARMEDEQDARQKYLVEHCKITSITDGHVTETCQ